METITLFENISGHIIQQLKMSEVAVRVCVAWLTDEEILKTLVDQAKKGVFIEVITLNDEYNRAKSNYFNQLVANNGKVYMIDKTLNGGIPHHKFCIIDREVLITGSYNWTNNAKANSENIIIKVANDFEDHLFIDDYDTEFEKVLYKYGVKNENDDEIWNRIEKNESTNKILFSDAEQHYDISLNYLKEGKKENALEFISEAISIFPHSEFYFLRHTIYLSLGNYLECTNDLFFYMSEIADNDTDKINSFKEGYNNFIETIKNGLNTYTVISEINQKTKINLGVFSRLSIEPHFFNYEELNPYPF